jgi:hypothetical protein
MFIFAQPFVSNMDFERFWWNVRNPKFASPWDKNE